LSHCSVLGFDFLAVKGAVVFKTSEHTVLNRLWVYYDWTVLK